jgi:soluble lytic murein transglycosylase-like protein
MQLIPGTAARFNVRNAYDPAENVRGGLSYLRWLLAYYRGRVELAAAAYNAGEGAVDRHRGVPPYAETRDYVVKIRRLYGAEAHPYDPQAAEPSPLIAARGARM